MGSVGTAMVKVCKEASAYEHRRSILEVWLSLHTMRGLNRMDAVRITMVIIPSEFVAHAVSQSQFVLIFGYSLRIPVSIFNSVSTLSHISVLLKSNLSEHV